MVVVLLLLLLSFDVFVPTSTHPLLYLDKLFVQMFLKVSLWSIQQNGFLRNKVGNRPVRKCRVGRSSGGCDDEICIVQILWRGSLSTNGRRNVSKMIWTPKLESKVGFLY